MKPLDQENREILITRYLAGEATPEEITELMEWLRVSQDNLLHFQQLKNIWDNSERETGAKMTDIDIVKAFDKVSQRTSFKSPGSNFWYYWTKVAAVLMIPLVLGNILYFLVRSDDAVMPGKPAYIEMFAAFGTRSALTLSDGTSVWLNSGSSIKYPDRFIGNKRTVWLKGEAYFEVESDLKKPFIVETPLLTVKATGTKFNVSEYTSADEVEVTLVSGKVEVSLTDDKKNIQTSTLHANEHFSFNKVKGTTSIVDEDVYKYISWKDGKLIFRNDPLSEVVKRIGRVFNIDIGIEGDEIRDYRYRATFEDESLAEILKLLKMSSPIDYVEVKRDPLPDGTFPRKKVIIYPARKK